MADALVSQFVEFLTSMAKEEVTMLLGAEDALQQLKEDVRTFSGVLRDAELKAFTDHAVRGWLADVKDLVYDADDIIDYSRTHAEMLARMSTEEHPVLCYTPILLCFRKIVLRHRTGNSIRRVNERVEGIRKKESGLNLIIAAPRDRGSSSSIGIHRQTDSLLEPDIVGSGIENDTSYLVGLLTREGEELGSQRLSIVAITGMGGVGKTTLAQKIYNHQSIKDTFKNPPPIWVCVSQQYSDEKLLKEIIRNAGGDPERYESFAELQRLFASIIEGKKLFLILDDVWAARVWEDLLRKPFAAAASSTGSRVLITTRDERVAKQMGAIHLRPVDPLTDEQSWSLLCKLVGFQEGGGEIGDGGEVEEDIGRQIVKKCDGLPLAIKTIAGVLRRKSRTRPEWEMVLKDPAWSLEERPDGVMGVLYLSYQDLPSELKRCFIFCSLFPEDYVFGREELTQLWVAEGLVAEKGGGGGGDVLLEDVADDYYNELLSRSLLQREPYSAERCKMHDLIRSLGQFLAGDEYSVGDLSQLVVNATNNTSSSSSSLMKLRHLFIVDTTNYDTLTQVVKEHQSLRTLFFNAANHTDDTMDFLFSKLMCLRVIGFRWVNTIKSLPKSLGNLIHLRYLKLSGSSSSLVELPETVGNLSNLQYLFLVHCFNLKKLPRGIAKLYKLRVLDLQYCFELNGLPAGIGRLQHLNCLKGFVTNEEEDNEDGGWCSLEELSSLSQLRTLTIFKLERALPLIRGQPSSSRGFILKHLSHLRHLKLDCSPDSLPDGGDDDDEKQKMIQLIFEVQLFPPPSLETFEIRGYFGKQLPALWQLPNLNELSINYADSVESIGPEFMGMGDGAFAFPMLRRLELAYMSNLVEWQWEAEEDGVVAARRMPRLEVLNIHKCPKLRCLPGGLGSVTTLTTLSIQFSDSLSVIENLHSLKVVKVWSCGNLTRVSNLPALQDLEVYHCYKLTQVEGLYSLQSLIIRNDEMESLPGWLLLKQGGQPAAFPMLKSLSIQLGFKKVQVVLHRCLVDGLDWPKIQHYPQVDITQGYRPHGRDELFVRYTKDPFTFTTNLEADDTDSDF